MDKELTKFMHRTMHPDEVSFLTEFAPWSYSKMNTLKVCPRQFHFQWGIKRSYQERQDSENKWNFLHGSVLHSIIEDLYLKKIKSSDVYTKVKELKVPESVRVRILERIPNIKEVLQKVDEIIQAKLTPDIETGRFRRSSEFQITLNESFSIHTATSDGTPFYKAIIDVMARDEDKLIIFDHKSTVKNLTNYSEQMELYSLMSAFRFPKTKEVWVYITDLSTGEVHKLKEYTRSTLMDKVRKKIVKNLVESARTYLSHRDDFCQKFSARNKACKWCSYREICN